MIKIFLTSFILAVSLASIGLSACDGKGKLVEDEVAIEISTN